MSSSSLPPQPPQSAAYIQPSNPTSSNPSEEAQSQQLHAHSPSLLNSSTTTEPTTRTVGDISTSRDGVGSEGGGIPTALARGVRGSDADRDREREVEEPNPSSSYADQSHSPDTDPDNQKMRVLAEGDVSAAQRHKVGFGEEDDLAAGLERKKDEQEVVKRERRGGGREKMRGEGDGTEVDVRAAVGGEGKGTVVV